MNKPDMFRIGTAIKLRRIQKGISQIKLAKQLGVSQTHLSNAENGRVMLSLKLLLKLKEYFNCSLDDLRDYKGFENIGKEAISNVKELDRGEIKWKE